MKIEIEPYGEINGEQADLITLTNKEGMRISVTNFGCILTAVWVKDRNNHFDNVVLGYEALERYQQGHPFFGAIVGRFANRIAGGRFTLNGRAYQLDTNELARHNHIHGGKSGFDKQLWRYHINEHKDATEIQLSITSSDGDQGYPGKLEVVHSIILDESNQLHFEFKARTDKATIINLTNHSYYNLCGVCNGDILNHQLKVYSHFYLPTDEEQIPTGEILKVAGSGYDFRKRTTLKDNMRLLSEQSIDNTFVLGIPQTDNGLKRAVEIYNPLSGRMMTVQTTQVGMQIYNASKLGVREWYRADGKRYQSFEGICFEAQHFPDSPNQAHFPTTQLNPGENYFERTVHQFSVVSE